MDKASSQPEAFSPSANGGAFELADELLTGAEEFLRETKSREQRPLPSERLVMAAQAALSKPPAPSSQTLHDHENTATGPTVSSSTEAKIRADMEDLEQTKPRPVRSAKDVINAKPAPTGGKSASSLHHKSGQRRMESVRPSASALFRAAKSAPTAPPRPTTGFSDPLAKPPVNSLGAAKKPSRAPDQSPSVVRTSLKLSPKKPPIVVAPKTPASNPAAFARRNAFSSMEGLNPSKTSLNLSAPSKNVSAPQVAAKPASSPSDSRDRAMAAESIAVIKNAASASLRSVPQPVPVHRPKPTSRLGLMDIVRPSHSVSAHSTVPGAVSAAAKPAKSVKASPFSKSFRSVKERFRPAPKGYAQSVSARSRRLEGFVNPNHPSSIPPERDDLNAPVVSNAPTPSAISPVDFTTSATESFQASSVEETIKTNAASGLGVIEDYHPQGDDAATHSLESTMASSPEPASPESHPYVRGGESPFFLKSVTVEKRPLSDSPVRPSSMSYRPAPENTPLSEKNVYDAKPSKKKSRAQELPSRPTVIVPPSRRSHAPLVLLLLLTVILGAIVGAFAYLCFFQ